MAKAKATTKKTPVNKTVKEEPKKTEVKKEVKEESKKEIKKEPVVVTKHQGPFGGGDRDSAFGQAMRWVEDNPEVSKISRPEVSVGFKSDENKWESWVTYETTE